MLDDEVQRFTRLVLDLLEISRLEAGATELAFSTVGPEDLVRQVLVSSQRENVAIETESSAPASVVLDQRRVSQVLTNLLDNADAYGGGAVAVVIAGTPDTVFFAVDDAGPGVPEHERGYVFERFARGETSENAPGTGLGLALVDEHVRLHRGRVWVEDSPAGGARFVVALPRDLQ